MSDPKRLLDLYTLQRKIEAEIRATKERRRRRPKRGVAECGTDGGYYRHRRTLGEDACDDCLRAHREYERERWRKAKGAA